MDALNLRRLVEQLAAEPRPPESASLRRVQEFAAARLARAGWGVERQCFRAVGFEGVNLLARAGARRPGAQEIVVGAHIDSRPETPGADDNASAVAALLAIAEEVRGAAATSPLQLTLAVYDLEEVGMRGSAHHATMLKSSRSDLIGMISLEMLGYRSREPGSQNLPPFLRGRYPDTGDFIAVVGNERSRMFAARVSEGMRSAPGLRVETLVLPGNGEMLPEARLSDHSPFWDHGFPALMVTDTSFFRNPHYHEPTDTAETLDYDFLSDVTAGVAWVLRGVLRD